MEAFDALDARRRIRRLVVKPDGPNGCWLFIGKVKKNGYARVTYRRRSYHLHRLAFEAFKGPIPPGMDVCHKCDVRRCARPAHLFTGTRTENMQDARRKGRLSTGIRHSIRLRGRTGKKLDIVKVREIRRRADAGERTDSLAAEFECDVSNIRLILRHKIWNTGIAALLPQLQS